jgi:hypothetical protein
MKQDMNFWIDGVRVIFSSFRWCSTFLPVNQKICREKKLGYSKFGSTGLMEKGCLLGSPVCDRPNKIWSPLLDEMTGMDWSMSSLLFYFRNIVVSLKHSSSSKYRTNS